MEHNRLEAGPATAAVKASLEATIAFLNEQIKDTKRQIKEHILRKALYLPAIVALRFNPLVKAMGTRLSANGKSKMLIVGAAMRKLLHLAFGVLKSGKPFDPNFATAAGA